jgi:hypothetical protein
MFTIKYRTFPLTEIQPPPNSASPACYSEHELIDGPFAMVSKEMDDGYVVVHAHRDFTAPGMTFGPHKAQEAAGSPGPRPTLWVMNEHGATVAKYDL